MYSVSVLMTTFTVATGALVRVRVRGSVARVAVVSDRVHVRTRDRVRAPATATARILAAAARGALLPTTETKITGRRRRKRRRRRAYRRVPPPPRNVAGALRYIIMYCICSLIIQWHSEKCCLLNCVQYTVQ